MHGCDCGLRSCSSPTPESDAPDVKITPALSINCLQNTWYQKNLPVPLHPSYPPDLSIPPTTPLPHMPSPKRKTPGPINRRRRHHLLPRHSLLRRKRMHRHRRRNLIRHHPPPTSTPTIPHPPTSPFIHSRGRPSSPPVVVSPKMIPPTAHRAPGRSQSRKHRRPVKPRRRRRQRLSSERGGTQPVVHHRAEDRARVGRRRRQPPADGEHVVREETRHRREVRVVGLGGVPGPA